MFNSEQLTRIETIVHHLHEHVVNIAANTRWTMSKLEDLMADFSVLLAAQAQLADEVAGLRSVTDGVTVTLNNQSAQLHALSDEIAKLKADAVDQPTIDKLAADTKALADQVDATKVAVTEAIKAGTPAAAEPAPEPAPAPADAPAAPDAPPAG